MSISPAPRRRAAGGYVLLEALIAVVIAAVGFIGAARMQTFGLAMNNSTQARQKATLLGYQMADRIRANQAGVSARAYDRPSAGHCRDQTPMAADAAVAIVDWGAKSTTGTNRDGQCGLVLRVRVGPRGMFPR